MITAMGSGGVQAADLVRENVELASLPEVCMQVQAMADDPGCTADEMGLVIGQDTALTARLLKLVNSAFFGFPARVETVSRAVTLAGMEQLRSLALAVSAVEMFKDLPPEKVSMVSFWSHSVFCGLLARELASACRVLHAERLFVAGLLHDIGRLLIYTRLPEAAAEIHRRYGDHGGNLCEIERQVLGFDHADAGAALLGSWGLPAALQGAVAHHHAPHLAESGRLEAALVQIANEATHGLERIDSNRSSYYDPYGPMLRPADTGMTLTPECLQGLPADAFAIAGLAPAQLAPAMCRASERFDEVLDLLYPVPQLM